MKKNLFYILLPLAATLLFASCAQETYTLYEPASKIEGIQGNWTLKSIEMKDISSLIETNTADVSGLLIGATPMVVNFEGTNFTVTPGSTQNVLGQTSGSWSFDNDLYPKYVNLVGASSTSVLTLGAPTRSQDNQLIINLKGGCAGAASRYIYILKFDRSN